MKEIYTSPFGAEVEITETYEAVPDLSSIRARTTMNADGIVRGIGKIEFSSVGHLNGSRDDVALLLGSIADGSLWQHGSAVEALLARRRLRDALQPTLPKSTRQKTTKLISFDELQEHMAKFGADDHAAMMREGMPQD